MLLLVSAVYWKLALLGPAYVWFDHYDMCQLEIPRLDFIARTIHSGHFPLWDPHIWAGMPVLGAAQPGAAYPLNLVFAMLPLSGGTMSTTTLNWLFLTMHFAGAWFFFLLCRDQGLSRTASMIGSISFSCGGYFGGAPWLDIGNGISLTPVIFLFAMRIWSEHKVRESAVLLGAAIGFSWLSGHHEAPMINCYAVVLGSLCVAVHRSLTARHLRTGVLGWLAVALALGVAISAVQTAPLYEFARLARRWVGAPEAIRWGQRVPYSVPAQYSLSWKGLAGILVPAATPEAHTTAFLGLTIIVLAVLGILYRWCDRSVRIASYLGLGAALYAMGATTPVHKFLYTVLPMLDMARHPVRGLFLVTFAVSLLAASGAEWLLSTPTARSRRLALGVIALVGALLVLVRHFALVPEMYPAIPSRFFLKALSSAVVLCLCVLWKAPPVPWRRVCGAVLLLLVVVRTQCGRSHANGRARSSAQRLRGVLIRPPRTSRVFARPEGFGAHRYRPRRGHDQPGRPLRI
ncbi:MAG: hypothetical protein ACLP59_20225 [Bryobacteraceae bacterium]